MRTCTYTNLDSVCVSVCVCVCVYKYIHIHTYLIGAIPLCSSIYIHKEGKMIPLQARCGPEGGLFHVRGTRRGLVVSSTPRPHFTPGKDTVLILQEAGWAPGPVWTGGKSRPHRDSIPDRPARSRSLYRLSYLAHSQFMSHI